MTANDAPIEIGTDALLARVSPRGAQLTALAVDGSPLLWTGDPAIWPSHAPILFPVIGRVRDLTVRHAGRSHPMPQHGFARDRDFAVAARDAASVRLVLGDDEATRTHYPFAFRLEMSFRAEGRSLATVAAVTNAGDAPMPFSFGYHPGFRWPIDPAASRAGHRIRFERPEPDPVRRHRDALLMAEGAPSPVVGDVLDLHDGLFEEGAIVFDRVRSRSVVYEGPSGPRIRVDFPDQPHLGIWTKPGAGFVCVEPWQGHADPEGFAGEMSEKPGSVILAPGETRRFRMDVTVEPR